MACSCHGEKRENTQQTRPLDQCSTCAKKHFDDAYGCFQEFLYTEANRDHIHRQLRAAVNHTFRRNPDLAKRLRDLAQTILFARDAELNGEWEDLQREINHLFFNDNPEVRARLNELSERKNHETVL